MGDEKFKAVFEEPLIAELPESEVKEYVPEGINIHITGTQLDKISNIEIYMKGE